MADQPNPINLASLFQTVAGTLTAQKDQLNNADSLNHDHGDNMVEAFNLISQAMQTRKDADPADQLKYASQLLRQRKSGSAKVYAKGLSQASKEYKGKPQVTTDSAINLVQALLGGGQASTLQSQSGIGDLLSGLQGGGGSTSQPASGTAGDLLGKLLGGASGQQNQQQGQQASSGLDMGDLLNAGMAFMNTKSQGGNNMEAIVNALVSGSAMGNSQHRAQSGALVVNSILQAISGMSGKK
jgi:hypothetical protein